MQPFKRLLVILLIITLMPIGSLPTFADTNEYSEQGQKLFNLGILVGDNDDLRLNDTLNRYEGLILAIRLAGKENIAKAFDISSFDEVIADEVPFWAKHYVQYALLGDLNITKGVDKTEDGKTIFGGNQTLNALQFSTFMLKATGYDVPDWRLSLNQFVDLGIISNTEALDILDGSFTRGKAAFLIDRILSKMNDNNGQAIIENLIKVSFISRDLANANGYAKELSIENVGLNSFNIKSTKKLNIYTAEFKGNYIIEVDGKPIGQSDYKLQLQSDQKTVYLDIQNKIKQNSKVSITIKNMLDENNKAMDDISYDAEIVDNFGASIISTEWMDKNSILIRFNEKIKSNDIKAYLDDKEVVSIIQTAEREVFLLLHNDLKVDQEYTIKLERVYDTVNYKKELSSSLIPKTKNLTMDIRNISTNGYDMVFNQRIKDNLGQLVSDVFSNDYKQMFSLSFPNNHPNSVTTLDGFRIHVEYDQLVPFGSANFYVTPAYDKKFLVDANDNAITKEYHLKTFLPTDNTAPKVVSIEKLDNNHFKLNIDEPTNNSTTISNYTLIDSNANIINITNIEKANVTSLIFTTDDLSNKEIALSVNNLMDVYGNKSSTQVISLTGALSKDAPVILTTGYYSKDQMKIEVRFSKKMNDTILNPNNYLFDGKNITGISVQGFENNQKVLISLPKKFEEIYEKKEVIVKRVEDSYGNQSKYDLTTVVCIPGNITKEDLTDVKIYAIDNQHIIFETSYQIASVDKDFVYFSSINVDEVTFGYSHSGSILNFKTTSQFANDLSDLGGYLFFDVDALENPLGSHNKSAIKFDKSTYQDKIKPRIEKIEKTSHNQLEISLSEPIVPVSATFDKFLLSGLTVQNVNVTGNIIEITFDNTIQNKSIFIKSGLYDYNGNIIESSEYYAFN